MGFCFTCISNVLICFFWHVVFSFLKWIFAPWFSCFWFIFSNFIFFCFAFLNWVLLFFDKLSCSRCLLCFYLVSLEFLVADWMVLYVGFWELTKDLFFQLLAYGCCSWADKKCLLIAINVSLTLLGSIWTIYVK